MIHEGDQTEGTGERREEVEIPKTPKPRKRIPESIVQACKCEYITGTKSIAQLAKEYKVNRGALQQRAWKDNWRLSTDTHAILERVEDRIIRRKERLFAHEERMIERMEKRLKTVDQTFEQIGELVEPSDLKSLVTTEAAVDQVIRRNLGAQDRVDVTTNGKDLVPDWNKVFSNCEKLSEKYDVKTLDVEAIANEPLED